jgi:hypothetical protein
MQSGSVVMSGRLGKRGMSMGLYKLSGELGGMRKSKEGGECTRGGVQRASTVLEVQWRDFQGTCQRILVQRLSLDTYVVQVVLLSKHMGVEGGRW